MKNNKIKNIINIIKSKKGIDKFIVYFYILFILFIVVDVIELIYDYNSYHPCCLPISYSNSDITPSSRFYNGDFEEINDRYLEDSVGFDYDLELEKKNSNIISIDITSYVNEELDWDKLYAYFYQYIENKGRGRCIFRNQGCYININDDYYLIYYLTPTEIYFHLDNLDNLENIKNEYIVKTIHIFLDAIYYGAIFDDTDSMEEFLIDSGEKSNVIGMSYLMWTPPYYH